MARIKYTDAKSFRKLRVMIFHIACDVHLTAFICRVLYVKQGTTRQFAIVDASMTELIRPALYHAYHRIENLTSNEPEQLYDVVGPVCESSDVFAKGVSLDACRRGDFIAIRSAGAYGESMASTYNGRPLPGAFFFE